jgi:membrane protein DedA with SNARE-associated domain
MGLKPALFWFLLVAVLAIVWKILDLPSEEETIMIVTSWLREYGLWVVLIGSIIETLLFVGFYFPGSVIIFLSVALSPDPLQAVKAIITVSLGMLIGYSINYLLGKYGWYKVFLKLGMKGGIENAKIKMEKNDLRYIFYTYWNPGLGSFTSTAAGVIQMNYSRLLLLMIFAVAIWNTFWGVLVYSLRESALALLDFTLILKIIGIWIVFEVCLLIWKKFSSSRQVSP